MRSNNEKGLLKHTVSKGAKGRIHCAEDHNRLTLDLSREGESKKTLSRIAE